MNELAISMLDTGLLVLSDDRSGTTEELHEDEILV